MDVTLENRGVRDTRLLDKFPRPLRDLKELSQRVLITVCGGQLVSVAGVDGPVTPGDAHRVDV